MDNNDTNNTILPTISKQLRSALFTIMQDGSVYTTSEIRRQMESRFNLVYKRDYNINHFWGVLNGLIKSKKVKRENNGFQLVTSPLQQQVLIFAESADCENSSTVTQENCSTPEHSDSISNLYTEIVNKLIHCYAEISEALNEHKFTASQISPEDIQALSKIASLKEDLFTLISKIQK